MKKESAMNSVTTASTRSSCSDASPSSSSSTATLRSTSDIALSGSCPSNDAWSELYDVLHPDVYPLILSFLDVPTSLGSCCGLSKTNLLSRAARIHPHWRCHVLQQYGVYYDDYMESVRISHPEKWRLLYIYVTQVHGNVDKKCVEHRIFRNILKPTMPMGSRHYRGSLELADNGKVFFWENGRHIQIIDVQTGTTLHTIDTGQTFRRYFHRMANVNEKLFVCTNDRILCYNIEDFDAPMLEICVDRVTRGRPLELLVHRTRLVLLQSKQCFMWDVDTLEFVCTVRHSANPHVGLEVQWMGHLIITWVRNMITPLQLWSIEDGSHIAKLSSVHKGSGLAGVEWVQVDIARVTWHSITSLDHFIVAALDSNSIVTLWDSQENFAPIFQFNCGCMEPFDLVISQDFLAVINDDAASNTLNLSFWKLWLQPGFAETNPCSSPKVQEPETEATLLRRCSITDKPCESDNERLSLVAKKMKDMNLSEVDSYFGSHRNFLNVCSFHKNGLESLRVYRSKTLKKRMFFPPAKITKFEEWLAIQVATDGTVTLYDFRPNCTAFDDLIEQRVAITHQPKEMYGMEASWARRDERCV